MFGYRYIDDSRTDRGEILHDGTHRYSPLLRRYLQGNPEIQKFGSLKNRISPKR